ncbi:alpha/beta hydrolase [soil metagenome]
MIPKPRPRLSGSVASADGTAIAWYRYGDGDRHILFIPTWNIVDARVVGHQVAALEPHAVVVTYDPRGHGRSDRPDRGYTFENHAADALAVMDANDLRRPAVVTASRGLNATLILASDDADRVERIVSVASYMELKPRAAPVDPAYLEALRTDWTGFIVPFMHSVFPEPHSEEVIEEMIAIGMEATPTIVATQESELDWSVPASLLSSVMCPTLILHGEDDVVPISLAERIAATMPRARLEILPNAGHRPDIRSTKIVNPLLIQFLFGSPEAFGSRHDAS